MSIYMTYLATARLSICLCLVICLSVCLFVCLSDRLSGYLSFLKRHETVALAVAQKVTYFWNLKELFKDKLLAKMFKLYFLQPWLQNKIFTKPRRSLLYVLQT
jgi:hypothetical protein